MTEQELWMKRRRRLQSEEEWQSWEYLYPLSSALDQNRVGDRKLRLLTAACVRRLQGRYYLGEQEWVVESLERQADASPSPAEVGSVAAALREVRLRCTEVMGGQYWQASIDYPVEPVTDLWQNAWSTAEATIIAAGRQARIAAGLPDERPEEKHTATEERTQCELLRDIFGNPFRPVAFSPEWRTSTATAIAQQMYDSRDFGAMPILADALQDAGCDNADILNHCRGPGPHVRGCWVVDLVLGKS